MIEINTQDKRFHDGNGRDTLGTVVTAAWLNAVQDELTGVVRGFGGQANGAHPDQVYRAVKAALDDVRNSAARAQAAAAGISLTWGGISDKPAAFTPANHVHPISAVTGLQTALDGKLSTSGGTISGVLEIDTAASFVRGKVGTTNKWYVGKGSSSDDNLTLWNYAYNYGISLQRDGVQLTKQPYVGSHAVYHAGNMPSASPSAAGIVQLSSATNSAAENQAATPKAVRDALAASKTYQKTGNFEIHKFPDGTMIQTYWFEQEDMIPSTRGWRTFTWAQAFVGTPLVFTTTMFSNHVTSYAGVTILPSGVTNTAVQYHEAETYGGNQQQCRIQFFAIGRWK